MSNDTRKNGRTQENGCHAEDLVLYLYDELPELQRERMRGHILICQDCQTQMEAFRKTLELVDLAQLPAMATYNLPTGSYLPDQYQEPSTRTGYAQPSRTWSPGGPSCSRWSGRECCPY